MILGSSHAFGNLGWANEMDEGKHKETEISGRSLPELTSLRLPITY